MTRIISVNEARKILGKDSESLDDYQIENIIDTLSFIAKETLEKASRGELKEISQQDPSDPDSSAETVDRNE